MPLHPALHNTLRLLLLGCLTAALIACGGGSSSGGGSGSGGGGDSQTMQPSAAKQEADSPQQVKWTYAPKSLELALAADKELNRYEGYSHSLLLCVYQLDKVTAFDKLAKSEAGIKKLLACEAFDKSAVHTERIFIQPGESRNVLMDRAENARFVGLVAGYYQITPGRVTRTWEIPLNVEEQGWLFWSSDVYSPGRLTMRILLGPQTMQRVDQPAAGDD